MLGLSTSVRKLRKGFDSVMLIEVSTNFQKGSDSQCYVEVSTILRNVQSIEKSVFPQQPSYQGNSHPTD